MTEGDLIINGVTIGTSNLTNDKLSYTSNAGSAIAKAAAINLASDKTGVVATVNATSVYGSTTVMANSAAAVTGTVTINGVATSSYSLGVSGTTSVARKATVDAINAISGQTGVTATDNGDDYHGVSLTAADGRNITVAFTTLTAELTGVATAGTYAGTISLNSTSNAPISISSKVGGILANSGFVAGTFDAGVATTATRARDGTTTSALQALTGDALQINGITVGAAVVSDDLASYQTGTTTNAIATTKVSSAIATAAAINKISSLTGVTAKANANIIVGNGYTPAQDTSASASSISLNGVTISVSYSANSTRQNLADQINLAQGQTGVVATDNGVGLTYTAADGRSISIAASNGGSAATAAVIGLGNNVYANGYSTTYSAGSVGAVAPQVFVSTVSLTSQNQFTISSASSGNTKIEALGFTAGTFGGTPGMLSVDKLDTSTMSGAMVAITALDAAIKGVSLQQSKVGAYQNRLDSVINNLTESNQNMSASRSRILDTEYASETTNLAKSQIISQAATAMLAQANQQGQSVLALLK
jgi:flagellin